MVFYSVTFASFFTIFFALYWFILNRSLNAQNILILIASYIFYAWSDWRLLSYIAGVSALNFALGILIERTQRPKLRSFYLFIGLLQGIGGLVFFKYFNFFIDSFNQAFHAVNININLQSLNIIIPIGISFFTFRIISYLLDIDKGKTRATKDPVVFFTYVSFFPAVLSGPIDKAKLFIPQMEKKREFNYNLAVDGLRQILWGLFKKVVIADNCAIITIKIFENYQSMSGSTLVLGAFFYLIQIYTDFSGYSDIAIGLSRLLGFNITKNFDYPLFSQNIAEYWRKWHISLTAWLTEYVFTPLSIAFRNYNKVGLILAILINFTIIGMWHGANWNFVLFGFLHGCYYIPLILRGTMNKKKKKSEGSLKPTLREVINMVSTFVLVMLTLVLFRSPTIVSAFDYYKHICTRSLFSFPGFPTGWVNTFITLAFIFIMLVIEWLQRSKEHALQIDHIKSPVYRMGIYYSFIIAIILFGATVESQFIYFQF